MKPQKKPNPSSAQRCARCRKPAGILLERLWKTGPQGNRRYRVCPACAAEIDRQNAPKAAA